MEKCLFCDIAEHKIKSEIVYEDDRIVGFKDINPQAPVHILIIPKKHVPSINEITSSDNVLMGEILNVIKEIAKKENIKKNGYRIVINIGQDAGQAVSHLHFHLLGKRKFSWPPG